MRWTLKPKPLEEDINTLSQALKVDAIVAELLLQRGIHNYEEAKKFFRPQLTDLHDPFLMKDMDKAVARIEKAIANDENILVYGDYDVDGTTSVALVTSYLTEFYPNVASYIPDRYEEGYGVSFQGIDFADDNGFSLIIALDCGIKALDKVLYAKERNIDFIICDHHRPGEALPKAVAVLDPKRNDCPYPYKELCGCGVGFKLIQALGTGWGVTTEQLFPYLDLVATAIGADIVPITGENRVLAHFGLQQINNNPRPAFKAMTKSLQKKVLTITDVVFVIAPRINAAGRMEHGKYAVDLLMEKNSDNAAKLAQQVEAFNLERRSLDQEITEAALTQITQNGEQERYTTVVYDQNWHKGVIGIVASRLTETYYRPTLVFTKSGDKLAASARSVKGFDVYNALEACAEYLIQFGGHKYAAGLTLYENDFLKFKEKFEQVVKEKIPKELLVPEISIESKIGLEQINAKLMRILKQFAPFGPGNMKPVFMAENVYDSGYAKGVGENGAHLKLAVKEEGLSPINAIGFNLGKHLNTVINRKPFHIVFSLEENEWNGQVSLQLNLKDLK